MFVVLLLCRANTLSCCCFVPLLHSQAGALLHCCVVACYWNHGSVSPVTLLLASAGSFSNSGVFCVLLSTQSHTVLHLVCSVTTIEKNCFSWHFERIHERLLWAFFLSNPPYVGFIHFIWRRSSCLPCDSQTYLFLSKLILSLICFCPVNTVPQWWNMNQWLIHFLAYFQSRLPLIFSLQKWHVWVELSLIVILTQ